MKNLIKVLILFILSSNFTHAEIVKPNNGIEPYQVIKIQLRGLMKNDNPKMDSLVLNRLGNLLILKIKNTLDP